MVCGSRSIAEVPEQLTVEEEVVLTVLKFTNHPQYNSSKGPEGGYDVAVYHVDDIPLLAPGVVSLASGIWPACFPREEYVPGLDHNDGQFFRAMEWLMFFFRPPLPSMVFQWF